MMDQLMKVLIIARFVVMHCGRIYQFSRGMATVFMIMGGALINACALVPGYLLTEALPVVGIVSMGWLIVGALALIAWAANLVFICWAILNFVVGFLSWPNSRGARMASNFISRNNGYLE